MSKLDRIRNIDVGRQAVAVRHVPQSLDLFTTHFPLFPVLPGVLILDDLVAVARLALGDCHGERQDGAPVWQLTAARRVRCRHFVEPGDSMEIAVSVTSNDAVQAICRGVVRVDGRSVTTVQELIFDRHCEEGAACEGS